MIMSMKKTPPHEIDVLMGAKVRRLRTERGMSQEKLGKALGLSFQQVQKYERGANRMGTSRLFQIAQAFGIKTSDLVGGLEREVNKPINQQNKMPTTIELKCAGDFAKLDREHQLLAHQIIKSLLKT